MFTLLLKIMVKYVECKWKYCRVIISLNTWICLVLNQGWIWLLILTLNFPKNCVSLTSLHQ